MDRQRFAVLGLGSFGKSLSLSLATTSAEVVAIDKEAQNVAEVSESVDRAMTGDATDPSVLEAAGVRDCDVAIVAIGENTESSIIATLNVQDMNVPLVLARAMTPTHRRLLRKLGVARVINPEEESAVRLAADLAEDGIEQLVQLGGGYRFSVVHAPERLIGRAIRDLDVRSRYGVNIVGLRRRLEGNVSGHIDYSSTRYIHADPGVKIEPGDRILLVGRPEDVTRLVAGR